MRCMIYRHRHLCIPAAVLFILFSFSVYADDLYHLVAKGETIYSISRLYKINQDELMRYNNIADASKLQFGMRLKIPSGAAAPVVTAPPAAVKTTPAVAVPPPAAATGSPTVTASPAWSEYTVSKNDTLYSIARSRGVTLHALREINGFSKNYVLKAGEKIKIPNSAIVAAKPVPKAPAAVKTADPSIRWPVAAKEVQYMNNSGVLVSGNESESIKSLSRGIVVHASPWRGYGQVAVVEAEEGYRYVYASCETLSVRKGDNIEPGTELGKLGIYPASGKPDLVFMVLQNGSPVDPAKAPRF